MLGEVIKENRFCFHDGFDDWKDAIRAACDPIIKDKAIEKSYVDSIIKNVETYGPYIIIAPDICIPHAQEGAGVNETCISFMKTERPVQFGEGEENTARLFFVLASENNDTHLLNLQKIVEILSDEEKVQKILASKCKEDLI